MVHDHLESNKTNIGRIDNHTDTVPDIAGRQCGSATKFPLMLTKCYAAAPCDLIHVFDDFSYA